MAHHVFGTIATDFDPGSALGIGFDLESRAFGAIRSDALEAYSFKDQSVILRGAFSGLIAMGEVGLVDSGICDGDAVTVVANHLFFLALALVFASVLFAAPCIGAVATLFGFCKAIVLKEA